MLWKLLVLLEPADIFPLFVTPANLRRLCLISTCCSRSLRYKRLTTLWSILQVLLFLLLYFAIRSTMKSTLPVAALLSILPAFVVAQSGAYGQCTLLKQSVYHYD